MVVGKREFVSPVMFISASGYILLLPIWPNSETSLFSSPPPVIADRDFFFDPTLKGLEFSPFLEFSERTNLFPPKAVIASYSWSKDLRYQTDFIASNSARKKSQHQSTKLGHPS